MAKRIELPNDIESLKRLVIEQRAALDVARATLLSSQLEIEKLKIELAQLKRLRFGRSSEKLDERITQLELVLEELEASEVQLAPLNTTLAPAEPTPRPTRRPLPEHLPRETVTHQAQCACPECGGGVAATR